MYKRQLLGFYILYKSFEITGESIGPYKKTYLVYLILIPFIYTLFWGLALAHEMLKLKRKW